MKLETYDIDKKIKSYRYSRRWITVGAIAALAWFSYAANWQLTAAVGTLILWMMVFYMNLIIRLEE